MRLRVGLLFCFLVLASVLGGVLWKRHPVRKQPAAQVVAPELHQPSGDPAPQGPRGAEISPLPGGILAFNTESNETDVVDSEGLAHFTFDFTNLSRQDVTIVAVDTSCRCTTAETPALPWTIAPQATGKIPVMMDTEHETGRDLETVTVTTLQGTKELTVVVVIPPESTNADQAGPSK